jgi:hypothetical protein
VLEKTTAMLEQYKAGTYVPDEVVCYDEAEIQELGQLLAKLVYAPSKLRKKLQSMGITITRSDFYSEIPTIADIEASFERPSRLLLMDPFKEATFLQEFLQDLTAFSADFVPPVKPTREGEYAWESGGFGYSDAMAYYSMIRRFRPKTIVEMGCGISTLIASMACERNGIGRIIAIEPFPAPFLSKIPRVELIQSTAQDLDEEFVNKNLSAGDVFFIDTTHTVKHDSDCLHIYLRILPNIKSEVFVHVHDIRLPGPLPIQMMRDHQLFWNEQYLLYAYLLGNPRTRVLYGSAYHHQSNRDLLDKFMHGRYASGGASLWFSQSGPISS